MGSVNVNKRGWFGLCVVLLLGWLWTQGHSQQPGFRNQEAQLTAPTEGLAVQDEPAINDALVADLQPAQLVFCTTDLSKVLVYAGSDTSPVHNARSVELVIDKISHRPVVTCKLYSGVFEPTAPETKKWLVSEIKLVDKAHFQKLIDGNESAAKLLFRPAKAAASVEEGAADEPATQKPVDLNTVNPLLPGRAKNP